MYSSSMVTKPMTSIWNTAEYCGIGRRTNRVSGYRSLLDELIAVVENDPLRDRWREIESPTTEFVSETPADVCFFITP